MLRNIILKESSYPINIYTIYGNAVYKGSRTFMSFRPNKGIFIIDHSYSGNRDLSSKDKKIISLLFTEEYKRLILKTKRNGSRIKLDDLDVQF